jgi:catechol 2,3-dioxygenase-like lactoylglutathione lyase family enzyme
VEDPGVIRSVYPVLCTDRLDESRDFYRALLDLGVAFECSWYTSLRGGPDGTSRVDFVPPGHESVPAPYGRPAAGVVVTVDVDDVDAVHDRAGALGLDVVLPLCDEDFGQRHFMVRDPNGLLLDVVQTIPMAADFRREVASWRRASKADR